eukprot:6490922-Amphidinium_carterae.2
MQDMDDITETNRRAREALKSPEERHWMSTKISEYEKDRNKVTFEKNKDEYQTKELGMRCTSTISNELPTTSSTH